MLTSRIDVNANGLILPAIDARPDEGAVEPDLVVCVHAFPDILDTFAAQLPAPTDAGYRVVSLGLPGYSPASLIPNEDYRTGGTGQ